MEKEKTIAVLNTLITINNDRIEGYETASSETNESDLKNMFAQFIETSQTCRQELISEIKRLGGEIAEGTFVSGKFFRVWMEVKAALISHDRNAILVSCDTGEDVIQDTYQRALSINLEDITLEQKDTLIAQKAMLLADYNVVKAMKLL
ncbi:MAG: PA2169 family four-helix-bundle protein [Saprospiraceae bacterium]|nr:PA2169 family four-helix-bundle protein [Saprospiraceae bacterium]